MNRETIIPEIATTLKKWVEEHSDSLFSWALYKTDSKETAEDLVQDTFLAASTSMHHFKGNSNPKTWLLAILKNKISDHYRKVYKDPHGKNAINIDSVFDKEGRWNPGERPLAWEEETGHLLDDFAFIKVLNSCMGKLPENWFAAMQLRYMEGKDGAFICQELEVSDTNYWQILHRAKLQLRKCLEVNWFKIIG